MDVGAQLVAAMDQQALRLIQLLSSDEVKDDGQPRYSAKEQMAFFEMGERWLKQRDKLRKDTDEGEGIELMKQMIEDPAGIVERLHKDEKFVAALRAKGFLPPLPRKTGSVSPATKVERDAYGRRKRELEDKPPPEEDDSALQAMLSKGTLQ